MHAVRAALRLPFIGAAMFTTVEVDIDLQTVICQVPSVSSRESVAAAKLQQPADASATTCPMGETIDLLLLRPTLFPRLLRRRQRRW
jgi:hypothetical protein